MDKENKRNDPPLAPVLDYAARQIGSDRFPSTRLRAVILGLCRWLGILISIGAIALTWIPDIPSEANEPPPPRYSPIDIGYVLLFAGALFFLLPLKRSVRVGIIASLLATTVSIWTFTR